MCGARCSLFVVTFLLMLGHAHRATLQTLKWRGRHCRVALLSTFSAEKRRMSKVHARTEPSSQAGHGRFVFQEALTEADIKRVIDPREPYLLLGGSVVHLLHVHLQDGVPFKVSHSHAEGPPCDLFLLSLSGVTQHCFQHESKTRAERTVFVARCAEAKERQKTPARKLQGLGSKV